MRSIRMFGCGLLDPSMLSNGGGLVATGWTKAISVVGDVVVQVPDKSQYEKW